MKRVIVETPYAANDLHSVEEHVAFAQRCMYDCLLRNEAPYASHLLYTQPNVLDDNVPEERELGILAGFAWKHQEGVTTVFYTAFGWSSGMTKALDYCKEHNLPYEVRA